jgi:site-specific DNA-methyltransferase (adenine-specific)
VLRAVAQPVLVFSKGRHDRDRQPSDLLPEEFKPWSRNVWNIPMDNPAGVAHPARFPEELAHRLVKLYSYPGDQVLDPFLGSGTTAVAAARLHREAWGVDLSENYVRQARARVAAALKTRTVDR